MSQDGRVIEEEDMEMEARRPEWTGDLKERGIGKGRWELEMRERTREKATGPGTEWNRIDHRREESTDTRSHGHTDTCTDAPRLWRRDAVTQRRTDA